MCLRVIARFFVPVGFLPRHKMHGLLPALLVGSLHVEELALNARIRTRVVITVDAILVFQQIVKRIAVDVIPALEIGIDQHRFGIAALKIQFFANNRPEYFHQQRLNPHHHSVGFYAGYFQFAGIEHLDVHFLEVALLVLFIHDSQNDHKAVEERPLLFDAVADNVLFAKSDADFTLVLVFYATVRIFNVLNHELIHACHLTLQPLLYGRHIVWIRR